MRFSEKLPKLRKENNLSQEQLADRLGVSRQAVSKWESGNSYPDMEKMLQMCKILNCHLEDIMDDGSIGDTKSKKEKIDIVMCMNDFLSFITKSYNMFCSMKFIKKIECLVEMAIIAIVLFTLGSVVYGVLQYIIYGLIPLQVIWRPLSKIIVLLIGTVSLIIFIHLFKIRYLDYYITIEDQNATEQTIEEPIDKKENGFYKENKKEKIIIRDPKHSTSKFIELISQIIVILIEILAIFIAIPVIVMFLGGIVGLVISIYHIMYGVIFLFIAIAIIGVVFLLYDLLELIYNFIMKREQHLKKVFIIGIAGLVICGLGIGLTICTYIEYDKVSNYTDEEYLTKTENIPMQENLYISRNINCDYKIDNSINDIKIEIKYVNGIEIYTQVYTANTYNYLYFYYDRDMIDLYKILLQDIKNKKIRDYNNSSLMKIQITTSQENYDKLQENYKKFAY
jgi:transcriptional regulator with XRE-family HTH domain